MNCPIKQEQISIVLIGSFNPAIFQPAWFAAHDLIPSDKNKVPSATLNVSHPEITDFSVAGHGGTESFHLQVIPQRLVLTTLSTAFYDSLRDLALGTFRILSHTPIAKMGINRAFHFEMPSKDAWNSVDDRLAPKNDWRKVLKEPGLIGLTIQGQRADNYKGYIQVKLEPSAKFQYGVFVEVNDHFEVAKMENLQGCTELTEILANVWQASMSQAEKIARAVVEPEKE